MNAIAKYALIGGFSGALYGLWNFGVLASLSAPESRFSDIVSEISNQAGAGLFYGVVVGAAMRKPLGLSTPAWLGLIVLSALSCYAAMNVAIALYDRQSDLAAALAGGAAGAVGALLLSIATAILSPVARHMRFFAATTLAGLVVGLALPVGLNADLMSMWIVFFALWQAAYAAAAAYATRIA